MRKTKLRPCDLHENEVTHQLCRIYGKAAHRTPGSGNNALRPGDVVAGPNLIECKTTAAESMSIKLQWILKVLRESFLGGKRFVLSIQFQNNDNQIYYLVDADTFYHLLICEREHLRESRS